MKQTIKPSMLEVLNNTLETLTKLACNSDEDNLNKEKAIKEIYSCLMSMKQKRPLHNEIIKDLYNFKDYIEEDKDYTIQGVAEALLELADFDWSKQTTVIDLNRVSSKNRKYF